MRIKTNIFTKSIIWPAILLLGVTVIAIKCASSNSVSTPKWNLGAIYNPASTHLHPSFKVYHNSDQTSLLLIKLFPSELLFNQANIEGKFLSKVSIEVHTYIIENNTTRLTDSITYNYTINQENVGKRFLAQIPLKTEMGNRYQLRVVTRDLLRKDFNLRFVDIDKTHENGEQNFNLVGQNGIPYFDHSLEAGTVFKIQHRNANGLNAIHVDYYRSDGEASSPTMPNLSDERYFSKPDSSYVLIYSPDVFYSFNYTGVFLYRFDTTKPEGLVVYNTYNQFPKINTPEEMIAPLIYITNQVTYANLIHSENKKRALDNFWIERGITSGKARELIRIYYNRVYFSNYYFTTGKPGWKTDRGMIYIVYGPPQNIIKTPVSETWIYYYPGSSNSISIKFNYNPTKYTIDNFELDRSQSQDWHWKEAVDAWQRGEIFLADE